MSYEDKKETTDWRADGNIYVEQGYEILPASDFLEELEDKVITNHKDKLIRELDTLVYSDFDCHNDFLIRVKEITGLIEPQPKSDKEKLKEMLCELFTNDWGIIPESDSDNIKMVFEKVDEVKLK